MMHKLTIEISDEQVAEVIEGALDCGGIGYWARGVHSLVATDGAGRKRYAVAKTIDDYEIQDELSHHTVRGACQEILSNAKLAKSRRHVVDLLLGKADATTYDVIAQVAVLGDVVYG